MAEMTKEEVQRQNGINLLCAMDAPSFARIKLGIEPDGWQEEILRGSDERLLMRCSRQSGKSLTEAIMALHCAVYRPGSLTLLISPSLRQSGEVFRVINGLYSTLEHPPEKREDSQLSCRFKNKSRIVSLPATEQKIRGYSSVTLMVCDEAARVPDDLFFSIMPFLAISRGRLVALTTPWGRRGWFYRAWKDKVWPRVMVKATDCPRITPEFLQEQETIQPNSWFRQEYLCEFVAADGALFDADDIDASYDSSVEILFESGMKDPNLPAVLPAMMDEDAEVLSAE